MKVIDLLNKIANGEEVPNSFSYNGYIFKRDDASVFAYYKNNEGDILLDCICNDLSNLNEEIEIIEDTPKVQVEMTQEEYFEYLDRKLDTPKEDKKIEKISLDDWVEFTTPGDIERIDYMFNKNSNTFVDKINEIIERLNGDK